MTRIGVSLLMMVLLVAAGCIDKTKVPSDVLPHGDMEAVMWDIIQAEQYSATYLVKDSARIDLKLENLKLYNEVFRLHHITRDQFRRSYQYYMGRADLSQILFDSLLAKGNRLRAESYTRPTPHTAASTAPPPAPATTPAPAPVAPPPTPAKPAAPVLTPADSIRRQHLLRFKPFKSHDSLKVDTSKHS